MRALLRRGDGYKQRPYLRSVVMTAQETINSERLESTSLRAPRPTTLKVDGRFGPALERSVKYIQADYGLVPNGIIGKATWKALNPATVDHPQLPYFRGDLRWVHLKEAHAGRPYWPGKNSGVTIDPGIDLGHADVGLIRELVEKFYSREVTVQQQAALARCVGKKGEAARRLVHPVREEMSIRERRELIELMAWVPMIRISRDLANEVMPWAAAPYWKAISKRFPLDHGWQCPPSVQTALLSLAYNRGAHNHDLEPLRDHLAHGYWLEASKAIGRMQKHRDDGIPQRRRDEAAIIVRELELEQA